MMRFELSLSEYSTGGWRAKMVNKALLYFLKNGLFLEALPQVAQRDGTQKSIGLRASFVAFRIF